MSFHVLALGIPALTETPRCEMKLLDQINVGVGSSDNGAGGTTLKNELSCVHEWEC